MTASGGPAQGERPRLRADAALNRQRILAAAREALALSGDASMQSIAKSVGKVLEPNALAERLGSPVPGRNWGK